MTKLDHIRKTAVCAMATCSDQRAFNAIKILLDELSGSVASVQDERSECELIALRIMEQHQGTDAGKVAAEISASIRARGE